MKTKAKTNQGHKERQIDDIVSELLTVRTSAASQGLLATMRIIDQAIKSAVAEIEEAAKEREFAHS